MRSDELYLRDIVRAANDVVGFLVGYDLDRFVSDHVMRRAILQALTEIGEAATHVSTEVKQQHPHLPWDDARSFRNFAVHQYFAIDWQIVWDTATVNVPTLLPQVEAIIAAEFPEE